MDRKSATPRRIFLQQAALAAAAAQAPPRASVTAPGESDVPYGHDSNYPRVFEGRHLAMIAFPLGGVGAGSLSLGGRGQLRDWEIFNRPNKGFPATVCLSRNLGAGRKCQAHRSCVGVAHSAAL